MSYMSYAVSWTLAATDSALQITPHSSRPVFPCYIFSLELTQSITDRPTTPTWSMPKERSESCG